MKNILVLFSFVLMSIFAFGQTPQAFKYQAVARDLNDNPVINQEISVKISILAGSPEGEVVYSELHETTSNSLGLINLEVGRGNTVTGNFTIIAWGNNASFIKTEMDITGGGNFVFMGTSQLLSVPYSLFSNNGVPNGQNPGDMLYWNGTQWITVNAGLNGQVLTFNNGIPVWGGIQLPILYTSAVSNITAFTANCGGTVVSDGGSPVIARGVCWNITPNPTTANNKIINGSGTGTFSGSMTGLAASSVYYVRAYATNSAGTSYGNEVSFTTTNGSITLTTTTITAITVNSATSGGNITNNGGSGVSSRGVCWNTSPYPTTANSKTTNGSGNGVFVSELTSLAPNTLYYVRAYATNSLGTSYGSQLNFTTLSGIVSLTTAEVTDITATTAISGGEITNDGGSPVTARGVCWHTSPNPTISDSITNDGSGNGIFVSCLTSLLPDTTYYVRSYATNGVGTYYGSQLSFTTLSGIVSLTTAEVTEITATTTVCGGEVTNDGGSPVTARGICWGTSQNPTLADSTTINGSGIGAFVSSITNLAQNTMYYVRAYSTNGVGTFYGNEVSFTTLSFKCGDVVSYGGQNYNTVLIGTQCWFKENLNVGTMINGANDQTDNGVNEKYCYDNDPANCNIYGGLYQWNETMQYSTTSGVQGICPTGWHLPTDAEWCTITTYIDATVNCSSTVWSGTNAGGKMKVMGTTYWNSPNAGATNSSGFTGLPGGGCTLDGAFYYLGSGGWFWSSTDYSPTLAWLRFLSCNDANIFRSPDTKGQGFSVRCLKDETSTSQLTVTPTNQDVTEDTGSATFEVTSNTSWAVEESVSWLFVSPMSGSGNDTLTVTYDANSSIESRIGQITITAAGGNPVVNVTITQADAPQWNCGQSIADARDGKNYNTIQIGTQCWMSKNLNIGNRIAGTTEQTNNATIEKYCYDNSETNCDVYGGLYQWDEMMGYSTTPSIQGICPIGWHLPTDADWTELTTYLGGESVAGGKMKETGTTHWWIPNTGATNSSGFSGLPGGYRYIDFSFQYLGYYGIFWSSTEYSSTNAYYRHLTDDLADVTRTYDPKGYGLSIRCLNNETTTPQLNLTPANQEATATSGITTFELTSNTSWALEEAVSWLSVSPMNGSSNSLLTVTYEANSSTESRIGQITITATGGNPVVNIIVTQAGAPQWSCGQSITDSRDGKNYNTVLIGNQCWMKENLNIGTRVDGIQNQSNNGTIEKYCFYNSEEFCILYGGLYQWNEMMEYSTNAGTTGICPPIAGWHIPSDADWTSLSNVLGGANVAGGKMKSTGTNGDGTGLWASPNSGATNSSGFTALPAGYLYNQIFYNQGIFANLCSSSQIDFSTASIRMLTYQDEGVFTSADYKTKGSSVRCLYDVVSINHPPDALNSPTPENTSNNQPLNATLSWECSDPDNDPLSYDVYFGTENPPMLVSSEQTGANYNPGLLISNTVYYWKIIAYDDQGNSSVGNIWSFKTWTPAIGDNFDGGIVAYIFQPGDPDYVTGEVHGLIAASSDQSSFTSWGCFGIVIGTSTLLGSGDSNTEVIVAENCAVFNTAARICYDLVLNGYDDWYLPSKDELYLLFIYLKGSGFGNFLNENYWSSSENGSNEAWVGRFYDGTQFPISKGVSYNIRAIRSF
jgi:uncharacterized protein (TIGR02145 family)